jgi:membrane protein
VYYSAQIFFLGAEFTRHYARRFGSLQHERLHVEEKDRPTEDPKVPESNCFDR